MLKGGRRRLLASHNAIDQDLPGTQGLSVRDGRSHANLRAQSKLSSCGEILYGRSDEALFAISMHEHRRGLA
jgi:hypothetical protein